MIDTPPEPPPTPEQVIERQLVECGLNSSGISVTYQDYLQSIEIVIDKTAGATSEHFACIKDAAGLEIVTFEDAEMWAAYRDFEFELMRPDLLALQEKHLAEIGLLDDLPSRLDYDSLEAYAAALERHAGVEVGSALGVSGDRIQFAPPPDGLSYKEFAESYSGLLAVVSLAAMRDRIEFFFIGNERFREE